MVGFPYYSHTIPGFLWEYYGKLTMRGSHYWGSLKIPLKIEMTLDWIAKLPRPEIRPYWGLRPKIRPLFLGGGSFDGGRKAMILTILAAPFVHQLYIVSGQIVITKSILKGNSLTFHHLLGEFPTSGNWSLWKCPMWYGDIAFWVHLSFSTVNHARLKKTHTKGSGSAKQEKEQPKNQPTKDTNKQTNKQRQP